MPTAFDVVLVRFLFQGRPYQHEGEEESQWLVNVLREPLAALAVGDAPRATEGHDALWAASAKGHYSGEGWRDDFRVSVAAGASAPCVCYVQVLRALPRSLCGPSAAQCAECRGVR